MVNYILNGLDSPVPASANPKSQLSMPNRFWIFADLEEGVHFEVSTDEELAGHDCGLEPKEDRWESWGRGREIF